MEACEVIALILSPKIHTIPSSVKKAVPQELEIFLTEPFFQRKNVEPEFRGSSVRNIDELLGSAEGSWINQTAAFWSEHGFSCSGALDALKYRGIDLGSLIAHSLFYYYLGVLKTAVLCQKILERSPQEIWLIDDPKGDWASLAGIIFKSGSIPLRIFPVESSSDGCAKSFCYKKFGKKILSFFLKPDLKKIKPGGLLFSSALRYATPFFDREDGPTYYLRDVFSFKGSQLGRSMGFVHLLPEYFGSKRSQRPDLDKIWKTADRSISQSDIFNTVTGVSLWPAMRYGVRQIFERELFKAVPWIDQLFELLESLNPRAVVVDEDVCLFNKTLVLCANAHTIPTRVILNGVPFFAVGCVPLSAQKILVWGESSRERLRSWGVDDSRITVVGAPQYECFKAYDLQQTCRQVASDFHIPDGQKILVLATQPFHTNDAPDLIGSPLTPAIVEAMVERCLEYLAEDPQAFLIIKLHPREDHDFFTEALIAKASESVRNRVRLVKQYDTPALLAASDLVLTIGSTVFFEGLLLQKPTVLFDDADRRFFEFMSSYFIPLSDRTRSCPLIRDLLYGSARVLRLQMQREEIDRHFFMKNNQSVQACREAFCDRQKVPA